MDVDKFQIYDPVKNVFHERWGVSMKEAIFHIT